MIVVTLFDNVEPRRRDRFPDARVEVNHCAQNEDGSGGYEGAGYPFCACVRWGERPGGGGLAAFATSRDPWRAAAASVIRFRRWLKKLDQVERECAA